MDSAPKYTVLDKVFYPSDIKKLPMQDLRLLCGELRDFIIREVSNNPGHLGANLGVVELTVALHYVYDTPDDKLVWDVGHQAYAHKILTGRKDVFHTNRRLGGISGFPKMCESEYDAFGVGHASTSISAALGIATAAAHRGEKTRVAAIIGDGSLSGGLAFEGLNNAGSSNADLLVVLNDNRMAIDPNVGAMKEYLLNITTSVKYNRFKTRTWVALGKYPRIRKFIQKVGNAIKQGLLQQSNLFEGLNFRYFGPVDGHDVETLVKVLKSLKEMPGPKLLHVLTVKGKGYEPAEKNQILWHAPGCFNPDTGEIARKNNGQPEPPRYQDVFGETLLELARQNEKIVGVTPAMPSGCSMSILMERMPERAFDVGIAEGHAVTFSAGLAANGMVPFCNIYSSFMQRAFDNVVHDVALQKLQVVLCIDRGGIVGEDGSTHQGVFDIASFLPIPDIIVSSPMNEMELRNLMYTAQLHNRGAFAIRYPRGCGVTVDWRQPFEEIAIGKGRLLKQGADIAVLTFGPVGNDAAEAIARAQARGISAAHIDLRFAKPLDEELLHYVGKNFKKAITIEDGAVTGGVGSAIIAFFNDCGYDIQVTRLGVPDRFIEHGPIGGLHRLCGYDSDSIYNAIEALTKTK